MENKRKNRYSVKILSVFLFLVLILSAGNTGVQGTPSYSRQKSDISNDLSANRKKQQEKRNELRKTEKEVRYLRVLRNAKSAEYKKLIAEERRIAKENKLIEKDIRTAKKELKEKLNLVKERIKVSYENNSLTYLYILLESDSLVDLTYRINVMSKIVENDKRIMEEVEAAKVNLEEKLQIREEVRKRKKEAARQARIKYKSYSKSVRRLAAKMASVKQGIKDLEAREDRMEAEANRIDELIRRLQSQQSQNSSSGSSGAASKGAYFYPVPPPRIISSKYGNRLHPVYKTYRFHSGVDLRASHGAPIYAAESGTVIYAGWQNGYGNTIIVSHGGNMSTLYGHCSSIRVSNGKSVKRGQVIGLVGSTGVSTGPHLHFEVRVGGSRVNPEGYI